MNLHFRSLFWVFKNQNLYIIFAMSLFKHCMAPMFVSLSQSHFLSPFIFFGPFFFTMLFETGRLSSNVVMTGNILLNGKKQRLNYGTIVSMLINLCSGIASISTFQTCTGFFATQCWWCWFILIWCSVLNNIFISKFWYLEEQTRINDFGGQ